MSETEWFSTGVHGRFGGNEREVFVRVWEPGDGVRCSNAAKCNKVPCGVPVAVLKDVLLAGRKYSSDRESITRTICIRHLAKHFDQEVSTGADQEVEQKSLEELAQRYWDQYQEIRERRSKELLEGRFSALPNGLRDSVIALMTAEATS